MNAGEFYQNNIDKKDFTKLTGTGISTDYDNIFEFAEKYAQSKIEQLEKEPVQFMKWVINNRWREDNKPNLYWKAGEDDLKTTEELYQIFLSND